MGIHFRRSLLHPCRCSMPTRPYTSGDLEESKLVLSLVDPLDDDGSDGGDAADFMLLAGIEPLQRRQLQEIGPEKLSLRRLFREAAERGTDADDLSLTVYGRFGYRLEWLP